MIGDYKNYQPRPKINWDRIALCLLSIAIIAVLTVKWEAEAEPQLAVVTYDCAPAFEMDMPINAEDVQL